MKLRDRVVGLMKDSNIANEIPPEGLVNFIFDCVIPIEFGMVETFIGAMNEASATGEKFNQSRVSQWKRRNAIPMEQWSTIIKVINSVDISYELLVKAALSAKGKKYD